jgi:hypothetical protein
VNPYPEKPNGSPKKDNNMEICIAECSFCRGEGFYVQHESRLWGSKKKLNNSTFFSNFVFSYSIFSVSKNLVPRTGSTSGSSTEKVLFVSHIEVRDDQRLS